MTASPRPPVDLAPARRGWPCALVALLALVGAGAWLADPEGVGSVGGPGACAAAGAGLAQAVALWWREAHPRVVLAVVAALDLLLVAVSHAELSAGMVAVWFAVFALWRSAGARSALPWLVAAAAAGAAVAIPALVAGAALEPAWWVPFAVARALLAVAAPVPFAEAARARALLVEALRERAEAAERDREARAAEAARAERALIARELHDIAAHHLSGIIVSAQAAHALVDRDPDEARSYLGAVRTGARTALGNLRQTLGLLREGDDEHRPLPGLAALEALVAERRARGEEVELVRVGAAPPLGTVAELTVFRMVQESLTNAAAHAPGSACRVELAAAGDALRVRVRNTAPRHPRPVASGVGSGLGLLGMRERAALVGAELRTGPTDDDGWENELVVPLEEDAR